MDEPRISFTISQLLVMTTLLAVFFGTLITSDALGAFCLTASLWIITSLSTLAFKSQRQSRARYAWCGVLSLFLCAWAGTYLAAVNHTKGFVEAELLVTKHSSVPFNVIQDDPLRTDDYLMIQHESPWMYVGNAWAPIPFITSVETGVVNEHDSGGGTRLYFLVSPISHDRIRSVFLWSQN